MDHVQQSNDYHPDDITQIGELGLQLLDTLSAYHQKSRALLYQLALSVGVWIAQHKGRLFKIDFIVNGLAQAANKTQDTMALSFLYEACTYIIPACDANIRADLDKSHGGRPWRILIMNYGIIATRTHNPDLMASAFKTLLKYFPEEAAHFFKQGLSEMSRLNYPKHVRAVMKRYAQLKRV